MGFISKIRICVSSIQVSYMRDTRRNYPEGEPVKCRGRLDVKEMHKFPLMMANARDVLQTKPFSFVLNSVELAHAIF